ncbi:MobP2 family relaxase [Clostridium sporogenes]
MTKKSSPSIVLKNKFETGVGNKQHMKELDKFIDYISRQEALQNDEINYTYTEEEKKELECIEKALTKMEFETSNPIVEDILQMEKYIDYMTRTKAIKINEDRQIVNGAFSSTKRIITKDDVKKIKQDVIQAKGNNSVMFQDVISFNNRFLEEEGFYDPQTKKIDEDSLYEAVKNMANTCVKKEDLKDTFWFATIHRNTDNIHIHMTMMERKNTRKMIEWNGKLQAKGLRKQSTIDAMKLSFGNKLLDRTNELATISKLRKDIPDFYKQEFKDILLNMYIDKVNYDTNDKFLEEKIEKCKNQISSNTRGYNELLKHIQKNIDEVTEYITKDNPMKKEYLKTAKAIDDLYDKTYGESHKSGSFYKGKEQILKERLGNAFVSQVKSLKKGQEKNLKTEQLKDFMNGKKFDFTYNKKTNYKFKTKYGYKENQKFIDYCLKREKEVEEKQLAYNEKIDSYKNKKDLRTISKAINENSNIYRAKQQYEEVQRKIEQEQRMREHGFEM